MGSFHPHRTVLALAICLGCVVTVQPLLASQRIVPEQVMQTTATRYGAHVDADGWVHFVVFAPHATAVHLLLFDAPDATTPAHDIPMLRTGSDWKVRLKGPGIGNGLLYMYRAEGPRDVDPSDQYGFMFNQVYPLNDPYAYDTQNVNYSAFFTATPFVDADAPRYAGGGKSIVYDHTGGEPPGHVLIKPEDLIVYELHVQDYTARIQSLEAGKRGTYLGLATPGLTTPGGLAAGLDHLVELGITAVELMPVMEYDEETGNVPGRLNHWGYMTTNFFAPESRYASEPGNDVVELKRLIKALHDRHIAVFLDVVYNHTGEGGPFEQDGKLAAKLYNFRGLSNTLVYKSTDGRSYFNNTGTGNDVDFSGPDGTFPKRWATESLELWYTVYGVDGFRFDLARVLADGSYNAADWVDNDADFAAAHLHAEPWDLGGAWFDFMDNYGYGFYNNRWAKWIGKYRDDMRQFSKSTLHNRTIFKRLIEGRGDAGHGDPASSKPWRSVNFLAVHDGYTMRDCVAFTDTGGSHNCWDSNGNEDLRRQRQKLMMGVLLTSQGVPLILQGDEFGRTKSGALSQEDIHNTYNYESTTGNASINQVNWIDWRLKDGDNSHSPGGPHYGKELFNWTSSLIRLRKRWTHFRRADFPAYATQAFNGGTHAGAQNDSAYTYTFEGPADGAPTQLAVVWWGKLGEPDLMVIYNEHFLPFTVPNLADWSQGDWRILARSWLDDDNDFCDLEHWQEQCPQAGSALTVEGRSVVILISDND